VTVLDIATRKGRVPVGREPEGVTAARPMSSLLAPDGRHIFVSNGRSESVAVIDVATRKVTRMIDDVDGRNIHMANGPSTMSRSLM
jgi:YVTN family beta-propeller protein